MALTPDVINRLAVVRYLFDMGARQRHEPVPGCFPALLAFDDAIELFLHGALLHIHAKIPPNGKVNFADYFALATAEKRPFAEQPIAAQVHEERNTFKHRGHWPTQASLDDAHQRTQRFLEANCNAVFGIEFSAVSLAVLIESKDVRDPIEKAYAALDAGRADLAMIHTAIGFRIARTAAARAVGGDDLEKTFSQDLWQLRNDLDRSDLGSTGQAIKRAFEQTHGHIADVITADRLGLNDARYFAFDKLLPFVDSGWKGDVSHVYTLGITAPPTLEKAREAVHFGTETILRMQDRTRV